MTTVTMRRKKKTLPAPLTRLTSTWVRAVDRTGRPRMEMRWEVVPYVQMNAA